jgi:uncharacterized membrane protein YbaN (DUF454 family)
MKKIMSLGMAYFFLGLGMIGVFIPLLPTVPFLLLSAWFAVRGSDDLHQWLLNHPRFGDMLREWEEHGAMSRKSKIMAVSMIILSWVIMYLLAINPWVLGLLVLLFVIVSVYIMTRPEPRHNKTTT